MVFAHVVFGFFDKTSFLYPQSSAFEVFNISRFNG